MNRRRFLELLIASPLVLLLPPQVQAQKQEPEPVEGDVFCSDEYHLLSGYDEFEWCEAMAQRGKETTFEGLSGFINTGNNNPSIEECVSEFRRLAGDDFIFDDKLNKIFDGWMMEIIEGNRNYEQL